MANLLERLALNAPDRFYVDSTCTGLRSPPFARNAAEAALRSCPTESLGDDGAMP